MTTTASWRGMIARLDCDTTDGRHLVSMSFAAAHFVRLPVPVFVLPKPVHLSGPLNATSSGPGQVCGRVDRVSVRRPEGHMAPEGLELHAEGMVTLDDVYRVRPDLNPGNKIEGSDVIEPEQLWPVGITVAGGELVQTGEMTRMEGPWQLTGMAIEHQPSVWPGVGIQLVEVEMEMSKP